jgi:pyridoxal phosphate enzyme (YggS family)
MSDIALNINKLKAQIPPSVKIVAVSKTRSVSDIMIAYKAGQRVFGENRVQELLSKKDHLPEDIQWHIIGHLQSNKVKFLIPFVSMIESVDTAKLLSAINNEAEKADRIIDCLLQFHIAMEDTKYGFSLDEVMQLLDSDEFKKFKNINVRGVMGMATFSENFSIIHEEFKYLRKCFNALKEKFFPENELFNEISMGMSGDYIAAVEEGSSMIRIGSLIFGERNPKLL